MSVNSSIIAQLDQVCADYQAEWIAVTKLRSVETLKALYSEGKKVFGENKAQELCLKYELLPKDIEWHFIGHLQSNKVKDIIDKVSYIHAVDSLKLLDTIQKEAAKYNKTMSVFIQLYIALEETKFGMNQDEIFDFFSTLKLSNYSNIKIVGLMAMASFTEDKSQIKKEFDLVKSTQNEINKRFNLNLTELSMGMSGDYELALESGATYLRIGSILYSE